jgi:hypothetical protein
MAELFNHGYALLVGVGQCADSQLSLPVTVKDMQALTIVSLRRTYHPNQLSCQRFLSRNGLMNP